MFYKWYLRSCSTNKEEFFLGHFELNFHVGEYLKSNINNFPNLQGLLYDVIPIKFTIFSDRNYHSLKEI